MNRLVSLFAADDGSQTKVKIYFSKGKYFLEEFPVAIFPLNSIIRHDAEFYGIVLEANEVE